MLSPALVRGLVRTRTGAARRTLSASSSSPPQTGKPLPGPWQLTYDANTDEEMIEAYRAWAPSYDVDSVESFGYAGPRAAANVLARHLLRRFGGREDGSAKEGKEAIPVRVLDAGCGTGLVGSYLLDCLDGIDAIGDDDRGGNESRSTLLSDQLELIGIDYSEEMATVAASKMRQQAQSSSCTSAVSLPVYSAVEVADLNDLGAMVCPSGASPSNSSPSIPKFLPFDAAVCVGTLTPGHLGPNLLDDLVGCVRPGGVLVFTLRTDFYDDETSGMADRIADLEGGMCLVHKGGARTGAGKTVMLLELTDPSLYTPRVSNEIYFRTWAYEILGCDKEDEVAGMR